MGGGRKFSADVTRRGGADLLRSVAEIGAAGATNGGSLARANEFCARSHDLPFRLTSGATIAVGDLVRLAPGDPPAVRNGGGVIGVLEGPAKSAINGCLQLDWKMTGRVEQINAISGHGLLVVAGVREGPDP